MIVRINRDITFRRHSGRTFPEGDGVHSTPFKEGDVFTAEPATNLPRGGYWLTPIDGEAALIGYHADEDEVEVIT